MRPHSSFIRRSWVFAAVSVVLIFSACGGGDENFGKRYAVSGTVTYNGQPLEKGSISFVPEKGTSASGAINKGSYALSTGGEQDGALPGKYRVTIVAKEDIEALAKAEFAKTSKRPESEIIAVPRSIMSSAAAKAKSLIPTGYGDLRTSPFTAEVKEQSNTIAFALSDAEAPLAPPKGPAKGGR